MFTFPLIFLISASLISTPELRKEFPIDPQDKIIVRDAISRWIRSVSSTEKKEMEDRVPMVFRLRDMRCVVLVLRASSVGGEPVYCYKINSNDIIYSIEDVE